MNKRQSGILSFLKKPKDTESVKLTAFRPDLPSPKSVTTKRKPSELSSPNSTPSKRRHIVYDQVSRERKFITAWLNDFEWLCYDHESNLMYCGSCREFKHLLNRLVNHFAPILTKEEVAAAPAAWTAWRAFKIHVDQLRTTSPKEVFKNLLLAPPQSLKCILPLLEIMLTISMSTAIVERGFSHMNIIIGVTRTRLGSETLNDLMEIQINGPSSSEYEPESSILHWLDMGPGTRHLNGHKTASH